MLDFRLGLTMDWLPKAGIEIVAGARDMEATDVGLAYTDADGARQVIPADTILPDGAAQAQRRAVQGPRGPGPRALPHRGRQAVRNDRPRGAVRLSDRLRAVTHTREKGTRHMTDAKYDELLKRLEKTERNAQIARDWVEISNLHGRYNHYVLGHHWERIVDELFATKTPGVKIEVVESGVFHGIEGVRKLFVDMLGKLYDYPGNCAIHEITTPVIQVQPDMKTAKGMWYHVGFNTFDDPEKGVVPIWQVIKYNHVFVKEDGQWKWLEYGAHLLIRSSYERAWVDEPVIMASQIQGAEPTDAPRRGRADLVPRAVRRQGQHAQRPSAAARVHRPRYPGLKGKQWHSRHLRTTSRP